MATLSRKQREIAERETRILDLSRQLMLEKGYLGLTMERVASALEYSKGTIYQHFGNKEEILAQLAIESAGVRSELFARAATFQGRTRERLAAVGVADHLFVSLHKDHFAIERIVDAHSIRAKTSEKRQQRLDEASEHCQQVLIGLVRDAVSQGDLELEGPETPSAITFGLWSMSVGADQLMAAPDLELDYKLGIEDPFQVLFRNYNALLDGFGWRPLTHEWDYQASVQRIHDEVFPDEVRRAGLR